MKQQLIDSIMWELTLLARSWGFVQYDSNGVTRRRLNRMTMKDLQRTLAELKSTSAGIAQAA